MARKLIQGLGINDASYEVSRKEKVDGLYKITWVCPYYNKWREMLRRCYSVREHKRHPNYAICSVEDSWLTFSNFKAWMETQDWQGKHLDKDLLIQDNKLYSKETCIFVSPKVNSFLVDRALHRGEYPLGVHLDKDTGKFMAMCSNPFTRRRENLGRFSCQVEAHLAWKSRKHSLACKLADMQVDVRIAEALRNRYK